MAKGIKKIAVGADHGGFKLKERLKNYLREEGFIVRDFGTSSDESCDYPLIGYKVAKDVSDGKSERGILICKTGIGMSIIANKLKDIRAAVCNTVKQAETSRLHNDTNVLSLAANYINFDRAKKIVLVWLKTESLNGRHRRRVNQIRKLEGKPKALSLLL